MPDFSAKMHQIQFRLGSAPEPDGEAYSLSKELKETHRTLGLRIDAHAPIRLRCML